MKKPPIVVVLLALLVVLPFFSGCSRGNLREGGSKCTVYLDAIPDEYYALNESIRNELQITVTLHSVVNDKNHRIVLTEDNGFQQDIRLNPGPYDVTWCYANNPNITLMEVQPQVERITLDRKTPASLPVSIKNKDVFIQTIHNLTPSDAITSAELYTRQVQYDGQMTDFSTLRSALTFSPSNNSKRLKPSETAFIPATGTAGVSLVVQNQTSTSIPVQEATFVGLRFTKNNIVLPKGITLGMDIAEICHAKTGLLGTPDYCKGTPMLGIGYDSSTAVYVDYETGDRISFEVGSNAPYITAITYEFEKYE